MSKSSDLTQSRFTLNGELEELAHLMREVEQFCAARGLSEDPKFQLTLALDELFTNAVRHGGCRGVPAAVEILLRAEEGAVRVEYRDRGTAFDPTTVPPPDLPSTLEERAKGGLGVHFVRQMMRNLQYDRCGDWNRLTMELPV